MERLLTLREVPGYLKISVKRCGHRLPFVRLGRLVRFRQQERCSVARMEACLLTFVSQTES